MIACLMSFVLFSCGKSDNYTTPAEADVYKVNILATQFDPATTTMQVGYKIRWTNTDAVSHSIVSDDGTSFNSGSIPPGSSFTFTPATTGTFAYHCGDHPAVTGIVYVVAKQ